MKYIKRFENIDPFNDEWDWEEFEYDDNEITKSDWVIFLPNPIYRFNTNFAVKTVLNEYKDKGYVYVATFDFDSIEKLIHLKYNSYYSKLESINLRELEVGDYFFYKRNSTERHSVNVITSKSDFGLNYDIQPLNYNGGRIIFRDLFVRNENVLIPNDRVKGIISDKINR